MNRSCASSRQPAASSAKGAGAWATWELSRRSIAPLVKKRRRTSAATGPFEQQTTGPPVWQEIVGFSEELGPAIARSPHPSAFHVSPRKTASCPQGGLDKACSGGLATPIRHETCNSLEAGGRISACRRIRRIAHAGSPSATRPRRDPTSGASACATSWARDCTSCGAGPRGPVLGDRGTFGRKSKRSVGDRHAARLRRRKARAVGRQQERLIW